MAAREASARTVRYGGTDLDHQVRAAAHDLQSKQFALGRAESALERALTHGAAEVQRLRLLVAEAESHLASLVASKEAPN